MRRNSIRTCLSFVLMLNLAAADAQQCTANGCGNKWTRWFTPDTPVSVSFLAACNTHDKCYGGCAQPRKVLSLDACQAPAVGVHPQRCCDQLFMQDLQNACARDQMQSSVLCEWVSSLYYLMVTTFGGGSFSGKPVSEWLRDDASTNPDELRAFTATINGFAAVLGKDAARQDLIIVLGSNGQVSARVEESMRSYAATKPSISPGEANRQARAGTALLYGTKIDVSGISQLTEVSIRSRLGDRALSTVSSRVAAPP